MNQIGQCILMTVTCVGWLVVALMNFRVYNHLPTHHTLFNNRDNTKRTT